MQLCFHMCRNNGRKIHTAYGAVVVTSRKLEHTVNKSRELIVRARTYQRKLSADKFRHLRRIQVKIIEMLLAQPIKFVKT